MPVENTSSATDRWDLTDYAMEYANNLAETNGLIGHQVFLPYGVSKKAGQAIRVPIEAYLKPHGVEERAPGASYNRGETKVEQFTFRCKDYGKEQPVDDDEQADYSDALSMEMLATRIAVHDVISASEIRHAAILNSTSLFTGGALTTAISTPWSTAASAKPITDVEAAIQKVFAARGYKPDTVVMGWEAFRYCRNTAEVLDRIKYQSNIDARAEFITPSALAAAFGIRRVLVSGMPKNTANENATPSISTIWNRAYVLVCKTAEDTATLDEPCIGRTLYWTGGPATHRPDASGAGLVGNVQVYRDETHKSDIIRCNHYADENLFDINAGHLLTAALS